MNTLREQCEAEVRQLLTTNEGTERFKKEYEQITGERLPQATYITPLIPVVVMRRVQYSEVALVLKDFFPAPESIIPDSMA